MADRRTVLTAGLASLATASSAGCSAAKPATPAASTAVFGPSMPAADVPVGSGVTLASYIVAQPTKGEFKAYHNACPHQRCTVSQIKGDQAICPCHMSVFDLADGSRVSGPTPRGLTEARVVIAGDQVVVSQS